MLDKQFEWAQFKDATNIKGKSRGSNMRDVDDALKMYWDAVRNSPTAQGQLLAAFGLLKACNSWLKGKKDKALGGQGKTHFKTRWDAVKALATAAFIECQKMSAIYSTSVEQSALDYERKKLRSASSQPKTTKGLDGGYSRERDQWVASKKQSNPISGTTLHEVVNMLTDDTSIAYDHGAAQKYGGSKVLGKNFDQMTIKDWQAIEGIMRKLEQDGGGAIKKHVAFLKKADRLQWMAMVSHGKLIKSNGAAWDTGGWDTPYAMDEYGNMFIGDDAIVTISDRLNHSSMLAGKDVLCAGTVKIDQGQLKTFNNNSGHYKPTGANVYAALLALQDEHVDLSQTKVTIKTSEQHGFGDLTVAQVVQSQGLFPTNHPSAY